MADNEIKIMNIDCKEGGHNPIWAGLAHFIGYVGVAIVLLAITLSAKMCKSDLETISKAWHGQLQCIEEDENE